MMQDVKLVDVAQQMVGKNMLPVAYKAALGDTKYRDLDGKVKLTFPTSHVHPYQGGGCLLACCDVRLRQRVLHGAFAPRIVGLAWLLLLQNVLGI